MNVMRSLLLFLLVYSQLPLAHASEELLQTGLKAYKDYEYKHAITFLNRYLQKKGIPKTKKLKALSTLALSQYNQNQKEKAKENWIKALELDNKLQIPSGQAPSVVSFFNKITKRHLKVIKQRKLEEERKRKLEEEFKKKQAEERKKQKEQERLRRLQAIKDAKQAKPNQQEIDQMGKLFKKAKPKPRGFFQRHAISTVSFTLGIGSLIAAGIFSSLAQGNINAALLDQGAKASQLRETAETQTTIANVLWVTGGVFTVGSIIIFFLEPSAPPTPPTTSQAPQKAPVAKTHFKMKF